MWEKNFEEILHHEKMSRLRNNEYFKDFDEQKMLWFFEKNGINLDTVRDFLKNMGTSDLWIEKNFSLLNLNEWKEKIFAEILEKWPFQNPEDLVIVIAEYIKAHMKYDVFSLLNQVRSASNALEEKKEKIDDELLLLTLKQMEMNFSPEEEKAILAAKKLWNFWEQFLQQVIKKMQDNKKYIIDDGMMELFSNAIERIPKHILDNNSVFKDLDNLSRSKNLEGFRKKFFELYISNADDFRSLMNSLEHEIGWHDGTEVSDILNNIHNGVCRHFSVILKEIYNELAPSLGFENTEMLYVANDNHAYNLLVSEWKNWILNKDYFDVTNFIEGKDLFGKRENMRDETELWVQKNSNTVIV